MYLKDVSAPVLSIPAPAFVFRLDLPADGASLANNHGEPLREQTRWELPKAPPGRVPAVPDEVSGINPVAFTLAMRVRGSFRDKLAECGLNVTCARLPE